MSTDLLEHFNNIEVKDWDLYHHNIGLKVTPKYKTGFVIRTGNFTYDMYDSIGSKVSTMTTTKSTLEDIVPIPSKGLVLIISRNQGQWDFDVFDAKTGEKLFTIAENTFDGSLSRGCAYDVLENGDIFILNRFSRILRIFNSTGTLINTVDFSTIITNLANTTHRVSVNSKLKVVAITNAITSVTTIYDIANLSSKVSRITVPNTSGYVKGFTQKGNLIDGVGSDTQTIRIHKVDYIGNSSLGYSQTSIFKNLHNYAYLRSIKDKIFFSRSSQSGTIRELLTMNEDDGSFDVSSLPAITKIHDIDDKYVYASDASNYRVYKRDDLSLLLSIPSTYGTKFAKSNKGNYENFGKYW